MTKNITEEYANWIYAREKQPPQKEKIKALPDEKQILFTKLCRLQQEGNKYYPMALESIRNHLIKS